MENEMVSAEMLKDPDLLSKEQIEGLLPLLDELIDWAKKVQDYALISL